MRIAISKDEYIDVQKEDFMGSAKFTVKTKQDRTNVLLSVNLSKEQIESLITALILAKAALE